jgi:predicted pyridoxine 5'-phosphate oxidase superfamily flavin-nucleotide-binding protein
MEGVNLGIETTSSSRPTLRIPTREVAEVDNDVFIPVDGTVQKVKELLAEDDVVFIRAGVASGKTTLARYMLETLKEEFVEVEASTDDDGWYFHIIEASGITNLPNMGKNPHNDAVKALKAIGRQGKTIVIDEAHSLFSYPNVTNMIVNQTANWSRQERPKVLLFSAAGTGLSNEILVGTPKEINAKYMWYPPIPNVQSLAELLKSADVYLSGESVDFFIKFCSGRRGVLMYAMKWVQEVQQGLTQEWDYRETVSRVKESLEDSRQKRSEGWDVGLRSYLKRSRAVRVNSRYSDINNIPEEFAQVLYGGSKTASELNSKERELTIAGFLVPERTVGDQEFIFCDWADTKVRYGISNSIMGDYYNHVFDDLSFELIPEKKYPSSAADLTAFVLPFLSFATVVDNAIPDGEGNLQSSLSSHNMPYEDSYNDAISDVLRKLNFTVSNPRNEKGKTDVVVTLKNNGKYETCAIESVMAFRGKVRGYWYCFHLTLFATGYSSPLYYLISAGSH